MRDLPIVFPLSLAIIVAMLIFTSAYAVSSNAVGGGPIYSGAMTPAGIATQNVQGSTAASDEAGAYNWYQQAALFVCPLH